MAKVIALLVVCLLVVCAVGIIHNSINSNVQPSVENIYYGPVPVGYDLEHYRNTGETILEAKG